MYTCLKQEAVINIIPTYKYLGYDTIKVDTTFVMDQLFPDNEVIFTPGKKKIPDNVLAMVSEVGFDFGPKISSDINKKLTDVAQEVLDPNRVQETREDSMLSLLLTYMDSAPIKPVVQGANFYTLSYEYNLYPDKEGNFDFKTVLPLAGLLSSGNIEVQLFIVLPQGVTFDPVATKGVSVNGQEIGEKPFVTENGRTLVTFYYKQDPTFTVKYRYNN